MILLYSDASSTADLDCATISVNVKGQQNVQYGIFYVTLLN